MHTCCGGILRWLRDASELLNDARVVDDEENFAQ